MRGLIPSPTSGIRKLLGKHFDVVDVCEYNTTQTCNRCLGKADKAATRKCPRCCSLRKKAAVGADSGVDVEEVLCKRCRKRGSMKVEDVHGLRRC